MGQSDRGSDETHASLEREADGAAQLAAQLNEARRQVDELQDKYLRAAAQAENARKWAERDIQARATENKRALLRELLDVTDNLGLALAQPGDAQTLRQGVQLTLRQLEQVLSRAGVQRIPVEPGQPFDPVYHEAIEVRDAAVPQDTVADVAYSGYMHDGFILRPARVVVTRPGR
jgi:molecular chaperone GrpE